MTDTPIPPAVADFIRRWEASSAAERANYQLFLSELCDLLGVPPPEPTADDPERNAYVFERDVTFDEGDGTTSTGRIDLYKRACFVLEAKQGSDTLRADNDDALLFSRGVHAALGPARTPCRRRRGTAVRGTRARDEAMIAARGQRPAASGQRAR